MKRKLLSLISAMFAVQTALSGLVMPAVSAEDTVIVYEVPQSQHETYNMNLDWQFYEADNTLTMSVQEAWESAAKGGKQFYDVEYDDSDWETVSIPHAINGEDAFTSHTSDSGGGVGRQGVFLYRKTFTVPASAEGGKIFFELEGIRQAAYVWVNGEKVGYYEAGITAMGFDLTNFVTPGENAVIAICEDCAATKGNSNRYQFETVPGEEWGSSYTPDNYKSTVGNGAAFVWNTRDFNETQAGLIYDAYLYVTGSVYQTFPLYNNLKTTGNYIYATDFNIRENEATINVKAEVRNETDADGEYTLEVDVVDADGYLAYTFESDAVTVAAATDAGMVYKTAVESDVYDEENTTDPVGLTTVNTPDVTYITASYDADEVRFWSLDDPYLYDVYTVLKDSSGNVVDVQKTTMGFRKVTYDSTSGISINDKAVFLQGYAQRSTNEWAVIGSATDWLTDYDMSLLKENNANFIRWMHVAPKPAAVRSSDKYGVAVVVPAGDKEGSGLSGRQWSQRTEAMRDAMIYFRNSPSVLFWETGNSPVGSADKANEMAALRDELDPYGMRFIGARTTTSSDELNYEYNYAGTMYGGSDSGAKAKSAISAMAQNGIYGPIMETEYARDESPRRIWDVYSPPDYDYVNKQVYRNGSAYKRDGYDYWTLTQEDISINNIEEFDLYYANRAGYGSNLFSAAAMMTWSDSNMHGRNSATENDRTSGRVDAVRQTKEMFYVTQAAQSSDAAVHIVGHWSYPEVSDDTYNYYEKENIVFETTSSYTWSYDAYTDTQAKRDPTTKTVYVIGSVDVSSVELYRLDGNTETLLGTDSSASSDFIYQFDNIDVTKGDAVIAKAYDARGSLIATDEIERTYDAVTLRLTAHTSVTADEDGNAVSEWRADGSDIAYIDVEVIDENSNVCALNYDKINFTYSGEGVYLGGYNSGSGASCFQNTAASQGLSFYFGGDKSGTSTIRQDYVYAENGTNRIFVRSTRNAGTFTLSASMDGMLPVSISITSMAVETDGGLTTVMQSSLSPELGDAPVSSTTTSMKTLQLTKKILPWSLVKTVADTDTTDYYDVYINSTKLEDGYPTYIGISDTMFGPVYNILKAAQDTGADGFTMEYDDSTSPVTLTVTSGGHTYKYTENVNQVLIDGTDTTECVDAPVMKDGVFVANLDLMLAYAGVAYSRDTTNHIYNVTVN